MSTALYRRYRPETFAEVIGQEHVTGPLVAALSKDRINHAYLFSGPRGCGKTTSARILARCLNCAQGPTATPCGECDSCRDLARGGPGSLDVVEIDAASHGGVDDARSLRERAVFAPARDRFKVFIIDEAHMVSTQGFNALLKIVEEPPPHVRFVFATTEPDKVIGTIRSRTHHYPFRLVPPERLQTYLGELCTAEGVDVGQGVLPLVVRAGAGSVRDSLSVLDQLIAGAGPEGLTYPLAVSLLGYTDATLLDDVVDALAVGDGATVFTVVDRVIESGHDPRRFVEDLLERLRDLLVVAAVPDGGHAVLRALPADQLRRMQEQAGRFGRAELSRAADVVNAALTEMTGATSPRLQLELLCARLLLPAAEETERGLRARVDRIEKRIGVVTPGTPLATPVAGLAAAPDDGPAPPRRPARPAEPAPAAPAARQEAPAEVDLRAAEPDVAAEPVGARPAPAPAPVEVPAAHRAEPAAAPVVPAPSAPAPSVTSDPGAPVAPAARGGGPDTATVRRLWPDVLTALSGLKRATWSLVSQHAQVIEYDGTRLLLGFGSPGLATTFGRGAHSEFLRQALIDVVGLDCTIEAVGGDRGSVRAPQPAARPVARPEPVADAPARPEPAADVQEPAGWGGPPSAGSAGAAGEQPAPGEAGGRTASPDGGPAGRGAAPDAPSTGPAARAPGGPASSAAPAQEPAGWGAPAPAAAPAEPAGWGGPARGPQAVPAETEQEDPPGQGAPGGRGGRGARGANGASGPDQRRTGMDDHPSRRPRLSVVPPVDDDIPLPDEPPPDDEPPPEEDPGWRPRSAPADGAAGRPGTDAGTAERGRAASPAGDPGRPLSNGSAERSPGRAAERPAPARRTAPRDDEVSLDDDDIEDSSLVGAPVVEQLLGGKVIDEREE